MGQVGQQYQNHLPIHRMFPPPGKIQATLISPDFYLTRSPTIMGSPRSQRR